MPQLQVYLSDSLQPHLNLATEEWIFNSVDPSTQILFLWRNDLTVVIGRNQNPWSECNLARMKEENVTLARRTTGGGAVFHDLGNTNFTFLSPKEAYRRENNIQIILDALAGFGVRAQASGRNDLLLESPDGPRKFSGSAYREKKDRAFHHGTLLLHADLSRLGNFLTPSPKKLQAKGKESVRARVANLTEVRPGLDHPTVCAAMIASFEKFYGATAQIRHLSMGSLSEIPELKGQYDQLSSWEWLYGQTLDFNHRMDEYLSLGFFDFHFQVGEGVIRELQIFSDSLYPSLIEELRSRLRGRAYTGAEITGVFAELAPQFPELRDGLHELRDWLRRQIEI